MLYTLERQRFTKALKSRLVKNGVDTVYIPYHQQDYYDQYVAENIGSILNNNEIEEEVKIQVLLDNSSRQVKNIFKNKSITSEDFKGLNQLVESSLHFLSKINAVNKIAKFVSHDYLTYNHCVHVFTYSMLLLNTYDMTFSMMRKVGLGALLHDIGKTLIPSKILNKPGKLNSSEWTDIQKHTVYGLRMCSKLTLSQTSINCILFHHEKIDGNGYLTGASGDEIPLPVKIITCCDVYDAITSKRPYADAETSANALKIMDQEMKGTFDRDVFQRFTSLV